MTYELEKVKQAVVFNTVEVLPSDETQLDLELKTLVDNANKSGQNLRHYIGFEISGQIHLGTGMSTAVKIKKLQEAGIVCCIWFANYHTWLNNKLDGRLETIRMVNEQYFKPVFVECCRIVGCDVTKIEFLDAAEEYFKFRQGHSYLDYMMKVAKSLTLARVNKSVTITGKQAGEGVEFGILCYPVMQVADPIFLQCHFVQAGMDQRKCHVLMREVANSLDEDFGLKIENTKVKPIAMHHKLLHSLGISALDVSKRMSSDTFEDLKMSKSNPDSAVWVHDSEEEIQRKLKKAYCPLPQTNQTIEEIRQQQQYNPILNWCENLIYPAGRDIELKRPEKFGGDKTYSDYRNLENEYFKGEIHPLDLKSALGQNLADWFAPIRQFVEENPAGLELVKSVRK